MEHLHDLGSRGVILELVDEGLDVVGLAVDGLEDVGEQHEHDLLVFLLLLVLDAQQVDLLFDLPLVLVDIQQLFTHLLHLDLLNLHLAVGRFLLHLQSFGTFLCFLDLCAKSVYLLLVQLCLVPVHLEGNLAMVELLLNKVQVFIQLVSLQAQLVVQLLLELELSLAGLVLNVVELLLQGKEALFVELGGFLVGAEFLELLDVVLDLGEELVDLDEVRVVLLVLHFVLEALHVFLQLFDLVLHRRHLLALFRVQVLRFVRGGLAHLVVLRPQLLQLLNVLVPLLQLHFKVFLEAFEF